MYLIDYFSLLPINDIFFNEEETNGGEIVNTDNVPMDDNGTQTTDNNVPNEAPIEGPPVVEYENIKKYIILLKLKQIKRKLTPYSLNNDISAISNDIDIILTFFMGFKYNDIIKFFNDTLNRLSKITNIKLNIIPELDNI